MNAEKCILRISEEKIKKLFVKSFYIFYRIVKMTKCNCKITDMF